MIFEFESRTSWVGSPVASGHGSRRRSPRGRGLGPHLLIPKQIPPSVSTRKAGASLAQSLFCSVPVFCLRPPLASAFPRPQRLSPRPCSHPRTPRTPGAREGRFDHDRRHELAEDHAEIQVRAEPEFEATSAPLCFRVSDGPSSDFVAGGPSRRSGRRRARRCTSRRRPAPRRTARTTALPSTGPAPRSGTATRRAALCPRQASRFRFPPFL
jgi:hypothetical protein